jgi:PKD repeat protein
VGQYVGAFPNTTTTYTVVGYNNGCYGSANVTLYVTPSPVVSFSIQADVTPHVWDLYPTCSSGLLPYTYSWDWGDGSNSNAPYPTHTYSLAGTYNIVLNVTDANGCNGVYSTSANLFKTANNNQVSTMIQINVINNLTTGIQTIQNSNAISIFPNPTSEKVYINMPISEKELLVEIFDVNGQLIMNKTINFNSYIEVSSLNNGLYTLTIKAENGVVNKKLTIVR